MIDNSDHEINDKNDLQNKKETIEKIKIISDG